MLYYSPLAVWNFTRLNRYEPNATQHILAIAEILQQNNPERKLLYAAVKELILLEPSVQLFLLPELLRVFSNSGSFKPALAPRVVELLLKLAELLPDPVQQPMEKVIRLFGSLYTTGKKRNEMAYLRELIRNVIPLVQTGTMDEPLRAKSIAPFTGTTDKAVYIITVALLADAATHPVRSVLVQNEIADSEKQSQLQQFIYACLDEQFGRTALIIALRFAWLTRLLKEKEGVLSIVAKCKWNDGIESEPDLVYAFWSCELDTWHSMPDNSWLFELQEELINFSRFRLLAEKIGIGFQGVKSAQAFRQCERKKEQAVSKLGFTVWASSLLFVATGIRPACMASWFEQVYSPSTTNRRRLNMVKPTRNISEKHVYKGRWDPMLALLQERNMELEINELPVKQFQDAQVFLNENKTLFSVAYSPWLKPLGDPGRKNIFLLQNEPAHWMLSFMATHNLLSLLHTLGTDTPSDLLLVLLHLSDQSGYFHSQAIDLLKTGYNARQGGDRTQVIQLSLAVNRICFVRFVSGAYGPTGMEQAVKGIWNGILRVENNDLQIRLLLALGRWIAESVKDFPVGHNPWLVLYPDLYNALESISPPNLSEYTVLYQLLYPGEYAARGSKWDWQNVQAALLSSGNNLLPKYPQEIHLLSAMPVEKWNNGFFVARPMPVNPNELPQWAKVDLAWKIERAIQAIKIQSGNIPDLVEPHVPARWIAELVEALGNIESRDRIATISIHRLLNLLRMVVDSKVTEVELIRSIVYIIIEFGDTPFYLSAIHEIASCADTGKENKNTLLHEFIHSLQARQWRHSIIGDERDRVADPFRIYGKNEVALYVNDLLSVYYKNRGSLKNESQVLMARFAIDWEPEAARSSLFKSTEFELRFQRGKFEVIRPSGSAANIPFIFSTGIQLNRNLYEATIHSYAINPQAMAASFFGLPEDEIQRRLADTGREYRMPGFLVQNEAQVVGKVTRYQYIFRVGYSLYFRFTAFQDRCLEIFEWYDITIRHLNGYWVVDNARVPRRLLAGENRLVKRKFTHPDRGRIDSSLFQQGAGKLDIEEIYPSYGELFLHQLPENALLYMRNNHPVYQGFLKLLWDIPAGTGYLALVYLGTEWSDDAVSYCHRFYWKFGHYYRIYEHEILLDSSVQHFGDLLLTGMKDSGLKQFTRADLCGMIVLFRLVESGLGFKLKVVVDSLTSEVDSRYPQLKTPADSRNIRWRNLFSKQVDVNEGEGWEMQRNSDGKWYFPTSAFGELGLPSLIPLKVDPSEVPFIVNTHGFYLQEDAWDSIAQRKVAPLEVQVIPIQKADEQAIQEYVSLKKGDIITAGKVKRLIETTGYLLIATKSRIIFSIPLEKISMLPLTIEEINQRPIYLRRFEIINRQDGNLIEEMQYASVIDVSGINEIDGNPLDWYGLVTEITKSAPADIGTIGVCPLHRITGESGSVFYIQLGNLSKWNWKMHLFSRVEFVDGENGGIGLEFYSPDLIEATYSWRIDSYDEVRDNKAAYIGTIEWKNNVPTEWGVYCEAYENPSRPGILLVKSLDSRITQQRDSYLGNATDSWTRSQSERGKPSGRIIMKAANCRIAGITFNRQASFTKLAACTVVVHHIGAESRLDFSRKFRLREDATGQDNDWYLQKSPPVEKALFTAQHISFVQAHLDSLTSKEFDLFHETAAFSGLLDIPSGKVFFHGSDFLPGLPLDAGFERWGNELPVRYFPASNEHRIPSGCPFLTAMADRYDVQNVKFWLAMGNDGLFEASFRTGFQTLEELQEELDEGDNKPVELEQKWYYVQTETVHPEFPQLRYNGEMLRFERGFGRNILIPKEMVRFNGKSLKQVEMNIFTGDAVTAIAFETEVDPVSQESVCYLNILESAIELAESTELYHQANSYNIVHTLYTSFEGDQLKVKLVKGFDKSAFSEYNQARFFSRFSANVDSDALQELKIRYSRINAGSHMVLLGRLNVERFRREGVLEFKHTRLAASPSDEFPGSATVKEGDKIYMKLGQIGQIDNDTYLQLFPVSGLAPEDVGPPFIGARSCDRLLRRGFSVREYLLPEVYHLDRNRYVGNEVLVYLGSPRKMPRDNSESVPRFVPALWTREGLLRRKNKAIVDRLANSHKPVVAYVISSRIVGVRGAQEVTVELVPGVFISVQVVKSEDYAEGDTVLLSRVSGMGESRLEIRKAAIGEMAIIGEATERPVVIFPKNGLRSRERLEKISLRNPASLNLLTQNKEKTFTLGDFPAILAAFNLGSALSDKEGQSISMLIRLMKQLPPRIAIAYKANGFIWLKHASGAMAGYLDASNHKQMPKLIYYYPVNNQPAAYSIPWHLLSYSDGTAKDLLKRVRNYTWNYHDGKTFTWIENDIGAVDVNLLDVPPATLTGGSFRRRDTGAIFPQNTGGKLLLRYFGPHAMGRFFLHYRSLMQWLAICGKTIEVLYAGCWNKRHWVEMAPGRVAEFPVMLLVAQQGVDLSALDSFQWENLEAGDRLYLQAVNNEGLENNAIILKGWQPGSRGMMGEWLLAKLQTFNNDEGSIMLGSGKFSLTLPWSYDLQITGELALLNTITNELTWTETLKENRQHFLQEGLVIFITLHSDGKIRAEGLEDFTCSPASRLTQIWKDDPLRTSFVLKDFKANESGMAELLKVTGALPVTVEAVENGIIYFTRRMQLRTNWLPEGKCCLANVLGWANVAREMLLLRTGSQLFTLHFSQVIEGVADELKLQILNHLKETTLWVHRKNYILLGGMVSDNEDEFLARYYFRIEGDASAGMVWYGMRSRKLYWMPAAELAWSSFMPEMTSFLEKPGLDNRDTDNCVLRVKKCASRDGVFISRTRVGQLQRAFKRLRVGFDELTVQVIHLLPRFENGAGFLAYSVTHEVFFICRFSGGKIPRNFDAEIVPVRLSKKATGTSYQLEGSFGVYEGIIDLPDSVFSPTRSFFLEMAALTAEEIQRKILVGADDESSRAAAILGLYRHLQQDIQLSEESIATAVGLILPSRLPARHWENMKEIELPLLVAHAVVLWVIGTGKLVSNAQIAAYFENKEASFVKLQREMTREAAIQWAGHASALALRHIPQWIYFNSVLGRKPSPMVPDFYRNLLRRGNQLKPVMKMDELRQLKIAATWVQSLTTDTEMRASAIAIKALTGTAIDFGELYNIRESDRSDLFGMAGLWPALDNAGNHLRDADMIFWRCVGFVNKMCVKHQTFLCRGDSY